jgi:hypothetical protein
MHASVHLGIEERQEERDYWGWFKNNLIVKLRGQRMMMTRSSLEMRDAAMQLIRIVPRERQSHHVNCLSQQDNSRTKWLVCVIFVMGIGHLATRAWCNYESVASCCEE